MAELGWEIVCSRDNLQASGDHLLELTDDTVRVLARELPTAFDLPVGAEALQQFRTRMAGLLGDIATELAARLGPSGPGLAIMVGAGLEDLADAQLQTLLFGISALLGRPIPQNSESELIVSVLDERPADVETARGYLSNDRMLMHTDPTDAAGLLCLSPSARGGGNTYVSAAAILDVLTDEAPSLVHQYFKLWDWDLRGIQRPGADRIVSTPIFSLYQGQLNCRYGSLMLRQGAVQTRGKLSDEELRALDLFEDVAQRPHLSVRHTLLRGQSAWLNNYRVLHGREAFEDHIESGQVRQLLRTWIWLQDPQPLAPAFAAFSDAIDREPLSDDGNPSTQSIPG